MIKNIDIESLTDEEKIIMIEAYNHKDNEEYDSLTDNRKKKFINDISSFDIDEDTNTIVEYKF